MRTIRKQHILTDGFYIFIMLIVIGILEYNTFGQLPDRYHTTVQIATKYYIVLSCMEVVLNTKTFISWDTKLSKKIKNN